MSTSFTVNGESVSVDVDPETPLLRVLRDELRLTGTKFGGGIARCGACTVHVNGLTRRSGVTSVGTLEGMSLTTIEGVDGEPGLPPLAPAVADAWRRRTGEKVRRLPFPPVQASAARGR